MSTETKKKQIFKKFSFKGVELEKIMKMSLEKFSKLLKSSLRRKLSRGLNKDEFEVIKACKEAHENNKLFKEQPFCTKARNTPVVNFMVGNTIGVYNGCGYIPVEIKPEMLGNRLKDYSPSKKSLTHGRPGVDAGNATKFVRTN